MVQEKIGRNFPIYVVIATLLPIPSHSFVGFHRLSERVIKPEPKGKSKHRQSGPMPKCRIVDPRKKNVAICCYLDAHVRAVAHAPQSPGLTGLES